MRLPAIEPPLIASDELELEPRLMLPVIVPAVLVMSKSPEVAEMAPVMLPLVLLVSEALLAFTAMAPVIEPAEVLLMVAVLLEFATLIAVPLEPPEIVPALATVNEEPPLLSPRLIATELALFAVLMVPALVTVRAVLEVVLELIAMPEVAVLEIVVPEALVIAVVPPAPTNDTVAPEARSLVTRPEFKTREESAALLVMSMALNVLPEAVMPEDPLLASS